jgi:subfamily B ATP-binding cassette protein MsbA
MVDVRRRLIGYLGPHKWRFAGAAAFSALVTGITLYTGLLLRNLTDAANSHSWGSLCVIAAIFVAIQVPKGIASFGQFYLIASATNRIATRIRDEIYEHLHKMSLSFFERNKIGHLMSRMTNDVGLIQNGAGSVTEAIAAPMMVIAGIARMFWVNWILALVAVVFAPVMSHLITRIARRMRKLTTMLQLRLADVAAVLEETMAGIRIVKSFGMEKHEIRRFPSLWVPLQSQRSCSSVDTW